jgi:hypothetical protein
MTRTLEMVIAVMFALMASAIILVYVLEQLY